MAPASDPRPPLTSLGRAGLEGWLAERDQPAFRARQVLAWRARGRLQFEEMADLPAGLRSELETAFRASSLELVVRTDADSGLTTKSLYRLDGGHTVEAVVMRYPRRSTLCISSQVGCPVGCPFCATGQGPFGRNLSGAEIVDQALAAARMLAEEGRRLSHVVFMGMGEPLLNYDAVLESVRAISGPDLLEIGQRRIVISTSGLVPRIRTLQKERLQTTLAISLHAARNELRDVLVPINRKYPLADLMAAAREYGAETGRRVSYEWVLLAGVNDSRRDATELAGLLEPRLSHVNLIPYNPVSGSDYREPAPEQVRRFESWLLAAGLTVTVRDNRGREGEAACGQLRARMLATAG